MSIIVIIIIEQEKQKKNDHSAQLNIQNRPQTTIIFQPLIKIYIYLYASNPLTTA